MPSYSRPVEAKLFVHLANGEKFEATKEDLAQFGYVARLDAYMVFDDHLRELLHSQGLISRETTEARLNALRYLVEIAINHPDLLKHPEFVETDAQIVAIERALQAANVPAEEE